MGVICVVGTPVAIATRLLDLSNALTFAVAVTATIISTIALREILFVPARRPDRRRRA